MQEIMIRNPGGLVQSCLVITLLKMSGFIIYNHLSKKVVNYSHQSNKYMHLNGSKIHTCI